MNSVLREALRNDYEFWKSMKTKLQEAYSALVSGGVKSYTIDDRTLTRLDLTSLKRELEYATKKYAELEAMLHGDARPRKAFGVVPRDW